MKIGMTKTIKIKDMMCSNCEKHVKEALEALNGVTAEVNHKKGTAIVNLADESVTDQQLIDAITNAGYVVKKVK